MSNLTHITDQNFDAEVLQSPVPVVLDFFAEWCGPCKSLTPIVEELAKEYAGRLKIGKIDVDHSRGTPAKYGILSIPTMILFKNGRDVEKIVGLRPKGDLRKRIEALIAA